MIKAQDMPSLQALATRGILTFQDVQELSDTCQRIYAVLADGAWHSSLEIIRAAQPATDPMRIMRFLRDHPKLVLEKDRPGEARVWHYRLVPKVPADPEQVELPLA